MMVGAWVRVGGHLCAGVVEGKERGCRARRNGVRDTKKKRGWSCGLDAK